MSRQNFINVLKQELDRVDQAGTSKRQETVIEKFTTDPAPQAVINGQPKRVFNSNDYLGLRFHPLVKEGEVAASEKYGAGPGAVRFISGSLQVYRDLEQALAKFHGRDDGMLFSSAFATNMAVLFSLIKGQSKDSVVSDDVLVVSDELNHRSIIDGIRIANLPKEQRVIFKHLDASDLDQVLLAAVGKQKRVLVVTDGVFSMLGEYQNLKALREVIDRYDDQFPEGVWLVVDDAHGVGAFGATGRGTEEVSGAQADVLIGTLGKAFGADGGYVVADQAVIDYLRESAATYIYSNSVSPGTAGGALAAVQLVASADGQKLLKKLSSNITNFKEMMKAAGQKFATDSNHPIQPWFIGDPHQTVKLKKDLFDQGILVTNINYPVVPKGKDELRVQLSAAHTKSDIEAFMQAVKKCS